MPIMNAHKLRVSIPEDHDREISVLLPDDFPAGPAEVIILTEAWPALSEVGQPTAAALAELLAFQPTEEEEEVLDDFESFRKEHPVRLDSLFGEP